MLLSKPLLLLLLATFTFISPLPFSSSVSGKKDEAKNGVLVYSWGKTERLLAEDSSEPNVNTTLVLAAKRTYRKDPLDDFKRYTGGYNISERHYWASVGYTAVPLFAIAAAWFVLCGISLFFICLCYCCCRREPYGYSRTCYALSLIFLIIFTIVAIIGCVFLYTGQGKFHSSTLHTLDYVVHQADTTSENLRNVSDSLSSAKRITIAQAVLGTNVQSDIDEMQTKIDSSASLLADKTQDNSKAIKDLIDSVGWALIVISAIMLLLTFLGFVFSLFGMQFLVYILVLAGWILVTGTLILCGTFLLLHNVTADTCVAMDEWVQNPTAHTALDDILPCVDNATAQETLMKTKEVTSQLVDLVNSVITNISNINFSPNFPPFYFNQSGPLVPTLCNPFNPDLTNRTCTAGEVDLDNATQVWSSHVCQVSPAGICVTPGRLTPASYSQLGAAVNVSYGLYNYGPFLVDLEDCTFARDTFSEISRTHCPGLRKYSKWIYVGLVMVAFAVMFSLLFWVVYGRERRHRAYTKEHMPRSIDGDKPS